MCAFGVIKMFVFLVVSVIVEIVGDSSNFSDFWPDGQHFILLFRILLLFLILFLNPQNPELKHKKE